MKAYWTKTLPTLLGALAVTLLGIWVFESCVVTVIGFGLQIFVGILVIKRKWIV